jgi:hypothetical protein
MSRLPKFPREIGIVQEADDRRSDGVLAGVDEEGFALVFGPPGRRLVRRHDGLAGEPGRVERLRRNGRPAGDDDDIDAAHRRGRDERDGVLELEVAAVGRERLGERPVAADEEASVGVVAEDGGHGAEEEFDAVALVEVAQKEESGGHGG